MHCMLYGVFGIVVVRVLNLGMQNFSKGNIFKIGVKWRRLRKMCVFNGKLTIARKR